MVSVLTIILHCVAIISSGHAKYSLNYVKVCNDNIPCKMYGNLKVVDGEQFLTGNFSCPIQFGDNLKSTGDIQLKIGNTFRHLFTISEKNICHATNNYLGPFFNDMVKASGYYIMPACPLPAGTKLHVNNYKLDFDKIKMQSLPLGTLRVIMRGIEKSTGKDVFCQELELLATK